VNSVPLLNAGDCQLSIFAGSHNQGKATASAGGGDFARALLGVLGKSSEEAGDAGSSDFSAAEDPQAGSVAPEQGINAKSPQTFAPVAPRFYEPGKPAGVVASLAPEATGEAIECSPENAGGTLTGAPQTATNPEKDPGQAARGGDFSPAGPVVPGPALNTVSGW
jgi:hypothetical protein